jgi:hypothetical protein
MISQVLQQALAGSAVGKLVQQHAGPHRDAKLAPWDQSGWAWRGDNPADTSALAAWCIAVTVNNTPIGLDFNLQHLRVFGAGKVFVGQAALRALCVIQNDILMALAEVGFNRATVAYCAALLSPFAVCGCFG